MDLGQLEKSADNERELDYNDSTVRPQLSSGLVTDPGWDSSLDYLNYKEELN